MLQARKVLLFNYSLAYTLSQEYWRTSVSQKGEGCVCFLSWDHLLSQINKKSTWNKNWHSVLNTDCQIAAHKHIKQSNIQCADRQQFLSYCDTVSLRASDFPFINIWPWPAMKHMTCNYFISLCWSCYFLDGYQLEHTF